MTHRHRFHHDVTRSQIERFSDRHPFFPFSKHEENTHRERSTIPGGWPSGFGGQKYLYPRWRTFIRCTDHKKAKRNISLFSARLPFFARVPLIFQRENGRKQISRNTGGRGYPRSDKSQVAPSTRKTHSKARRTTITPSLVLDEFLFIRSILGSLLLPLFFFFFFPPLHTLSSLFLAPPLQVPIGTYPSSTRIQFQRRRRILCAKRSARTEREGKKNFALVVIVVVGGE